MQRVEPQTSSMTTLPTVATLDQLIEELHKVFKEDKVDVDEVHYLMRSYKSNPEEWKKYAKFDRYRYTRNLVNEGNGKFNLMILCWGENQASTIHDHSDAHCFMKMLQGELREVRYDWPEGEGDQILQETGSSPLEENGVCYINDSIGLHRVMNPSHTERSVSLHLYCPPFDSCNCFDLRTGRKTKSTVTFWSRFGEKIHRNDPCHQANPNPVLNLVVKE